MCSDLNPATDFIVKSEKYLFWAYAMRNEQLLVQYLSGSEMNTVKYKYLSKSLSSSPS